MKNILFLMGVYPNYGGVEKVSTILANEFFRRGHGVVIVSFEQPHPELIEKELDGNVRLYKLDYPVRKRANVARLHSILRENNISVIINQWCVPYYVAQLCRRAMKGIECSLVSVHHNLPDTNARIKAIEIDMAKHKGSALRNRLKLWAVRKVSQLSLRYTCSHSDKYVVLSPSFIPLLEAFVGKLLGNKVISIPNPITITGFEQSRSCTNRNKEVIYVGRIEYNQKRTFRLVDIWKDVEKLHPDWKLTIIGDGPDRADFERRIFDASLNNVEIVGFSDPTEYYKRASILLLVSEYEGFPLVLTESMAFGVVPIVLGSYSAAYDVVDDGSGIVTSYPYDRNEFLENLLMLIEDDNLRRQMSAHAVIASKKFQLPGIIECWEKLFNVL